MRSYHTQHGIRSFPVYSASFLADDKLALGGGGGASRTGVKNSLRLYKVPDEKAIELLDTFELEKGEDAPMSMAVDAVTSKVICGINSSEERLEQGINENCRVFVIEEDKIKAGPTTNTLKISAKGVDDFQKVTVLSPDCTLLAVAGTHDFTLLSYPSLLPAGLSIKTEHDIYDVTFSSSSLLIATARQLLVYALPFKSESESNGPESSSDSPKPKSKSKKAKGKSPTPLVLKLETVGEPIERPALPGIIEGSATFRAARFLPGDDKVLYTVLNAIPKSSTSKRSKVTPKQGFICKWDVETRKVLKFRKIGDRGITSFEISPDGRFLAYGAADLTIGLLDAQSLATMLNILKAHEFPPTTLRFNPSSKLLASGSPDNSIRLVVVPSSVGDSNGWTKLVLTLLALIIILLAFLYQKYTLQS